MAYNTIEKQRIEEYERNLKLVGTNKSSIDMPTSMNVPGAKRYLPTNSGQEAIAIMRAQNKTNDNTWFKKSKAMEEENSAKSLAKTIASTGYDISGNFLRGVGSIIEGASDTAKYGYAGIQNLLGNKEKANQIRNEASQVNNFENFLGFNEEQTKNSVLGKKSEGIAQGIGYYGGMIALQTVGVPWEATSSLTSFGGSYGEALNEGATSGQAFLFGLGSAAAEIMSEKIFSGINLPRTGKNILNTEKFVETQTDKIKNELVKRLVKFGISSIGEGAEEIISGVATEAAKRLIYSDKWDYSTQDAFDDFISGTIVAGITGGAQNLFLKNGNGKVNIEDQKTNNILTVNELINQKRNQNQNDNTNVSIQQQELIEEINKYNQLQKESNLNLQQEQYLEELKAQLNDIQSQNTDNNISLPVRESTSTVQDVVNQENANQTNTDINLPINNNNTNANIEVSLKQRQNEIIQNSNPVNDAYHTWIRTVNDIKTYKEALNDADYKEYFEAGENFDDSYTANMAKEALESGKITVYSSNPIEQGTFVSPSKMEAESYSASGKVYSKEVNLTDIAWIDPTQGQYAKVSSDILPVLDVTSINNTNKAIIPIDNSQINQVKGNIPINQELLNKYSTAREIFDNESNNFDGKVNVKNNIPELNNIDVFSMKPKEIKELAYSIFEKYNSKSIFENDGNKITVSKSGINESIEKIFNSKVQRSLLKEHLQVFSDLGDIIENATLVNQTKETKNRSNINSWNYYFDGLNINNELYHLEFDVRSLDTGENQYRVQRLQKKQTTHSGDVSNNTKILPAFEQSAFSNDNISQSNNNVKSDISPTINNMQNTEINTKKDLLPTKEYFDNKLNNILNPNEISKLTKNDANTTPILPTRVNANKASDGDSHFAKNIKDKVNMLNVDQKAEILSNEDVRYYDKVTNKESLEKAFQKLNDGGSSESSRWFNTKAKDMDATDVAEGWILLKQYADNGDYDSMVEVAKKMREIGTTAGQTVQAFNIMERMTPEGMVKYAQSELSEAYDRMVENKSKEWIDSHREDFDLKPNEVKFIMDTMQEIKNMEDGYDKRVKLAEIQKLMTDKLPPEKGAKIKSWMRIAMLFNPKTQVRNVAGNALIMPINSFGDLFSSYADKLIAKKTGVRTTGNTNIKAMLEGIKKGAYEATNDYKKGINTKDMEGNRFEISNGKSFSEKNLMGRALNRTEALLNYVMDVGDRVFSEAAFENSLQNQMVLNNTTEITQEMIDIAHQEALSRTWNDNNNYTEFVLKARAGLNQFVNFRGYGMGDVMIPFAKTPANLTKAIVDYSPAGLVSTINKGINLKKSLTNGQYTATMQHEFVQSLGKATAGTMLYILGVALAKAGITNGDSDDDKDTANFLKNTLGISSYSIKIGDKSFTYDWAQPLAAPLSITANVVNSKKNDTQALLEGIIGSLDTAGSILLEQSFLQSINDVLSDNDGVASGIINEVLELPARAVPTFSKQIADLVDDTQRTSFEYGKPVQSAINSIKAKIPFVSKTLSPSVDTLGREIKKYGGKNNIFNVFLNPANVNTENISKSAEEIYRLYKETGDQTIMPRVAPYYINKNGEKITMTSKERAEYQKISGKIIEDNVQLLLKDNSYKEMNDTEKTEVINKIINYSYNKAREEVLDIEMSNEYNKINSYVNDGGKVANYYLNKKEIDYSYTNPSKYKVITQITTYNNYLSYKKNLDEIKDNYTNTSQRKAAIIKYVDSLNLTIPQKAMLIKMNYSSYNDYNNQIINYINSQKLSMSEKQEILEQLGFKVRNGKVYSK